jgi:hypothetical protein
MTNKGLKKIKVLCYLDNPTGRDTEITLPIAYGLEKYFNCEVQFHFIWDLYAIKREKPDLILLPNAVGHHMYFEIAKYAYQSGIKVFAMESEGNIRTDGSFNYWGYNEDQFFYQEWVTCWSERTQEYLMKIAPEAQKEKIVVTGGTGFDRYLICSFQDRKGFLKKYKKERFTKIIGYAGWAFGKIYGAYKDSAMSHIFPEDKEKRFDWVENNRVFVRNILKEAIEDNPDILFILKRHPKEFYESEPTEGLNEMNELRHFDNVLYIVAEEQIHDLINVSDFWLGFETTTALEAWLLSKETFLINKKEDDFPRDDLHKGSPKVESYTELKKIIAEYYLMGKIESFHEKEIQNQRNQLIKDTIGFADGFNHLRTLYFLSKTLEDIRKPNRNPKFNLRHLRLYFLMHIGKYFYYRPIFEKLPFFRKTVYVFETMNMAGFNERKLEYFKYLNNFHKSKEIDKKLVQRDWKEIFPAGFAQED